MTQYSYSRVDLYERCPYHFKLRYIDKLTEVPDFTANNPLIIGNALHKGIEMDSETMLEEYFNSFPIITDDIINESIKLEAMLPKAKEFLSQFEGCELIHEYKLDHPEYVGFVDLIIRLPDGSCMVVDFKYSNHTNNYLESEQLHIYKFYLEQEGFNVERLGYLFVEKLNLKQGKTEYIYHYRKRLVNELKKAKVNFVPIIYDRAKVVDFKLKIRRIENAAEYPKNPKGECFSCKAIEAKKQGRWTPLSVPYYLETIQENGEIILKLPSVERRNIEKVTKRVFWLYGAPFTGKTTFANEFPNPLVLNTDGNIRFVDAPYISIADEVISTGRITDTIKAWDKLKDAISELEKKDNDFQTIVVDLLEDTYQSARGYMYDKLGIEHESDNSFKAWDMVRQEFLNVIKRLVHLPYENIIFISHEDISKDVTKKTGDKITAITPNLQDKAALKVAGMVDIVGRVVADDEERKIIFKSKDYVFGGGRLPKLPVTEIDLDVDELIAVYDEANKNLKEGRKKDKKSKSTEKAIKGEEKSKRKRRSKQEEPEEVEPELEETNADTVEEPEEEPVAKPARKRRSRKSEESSSEEDEMTPPGEEDSDEEEITEELPQRKRRERNPKEEVEAVEEEPVRRRRRRSK